MSVRVGYKNREACQVMTNSDTEGRIRLSYPHTHNGFFFLLTTVFIYFKNKLPEVPEYLEGLNGSYFHFSDNSQF